MPYRLYIDESGDHTYKQAQNPAQRYLCLTGCIIEQADHDFGLKPTFDALKSRHFHDYVQSGQPVVLHRNDMINKRGPFSILTDPLRKAAFDADLLSILRRQRYLIISVVIDKYAHLSKHGSHAWHPYHYSLTVLLERYASFLNVKNATGDVIVEARGKGEDRLLKATYEYVYSVGTTYVTRKVIQATLTSKALKLQTKTDQLAGLELADLLAYPCKQGILLENGVIPSLGNVFGTQIWECIQHKFNRRFKDGMVAGYGRVFLSPYV